MSDKSKKRSREGEPKADEEDEERATLTPPFDPIAFARDILGPSATSDAPKRTSAPVKDSKKPTPKGTPVVRPPRPTLSDPGEIEEGSKPVLVSTKPPRRDSDGIPEVDTDEIATRPPPPIQQELIDSLARNSAPDLPPPSFVPLSDDAPELEAVASEQEMNDRVSLGDYTGALDIAEKLLLLQPANEEAKACAENCRSVLKQMYAARIGAFDRVPVVTVPRDQLRWLSIDHRAGFVLSLIDGVSSLEMILDVSGMPELDALRILSELVQQRIISFR